MDENTKSSPAAPASAKPKRGKKGLLIAAASTLVVIAGAAGAFWFFSARQPAHASAEKPPVAVEHGLLSLEPLVVNLADSGGERLLRVSIRLVVGTREEAEKFQKNEVALTQLRSAILELLTQQTAEQLVTVDGKVALRQAILERAKAVLEGGTVVDVLFSDFVVQF
jgi:flagellar protein FliL